MSADWFCKIGEKKYGPLNGQQLKTIVAKGQLKPEHLVRRGSEGPWVPAGRIKGLFPEGGAGNGKSQGTSPGKKLPQATAKPLPKAGAKAGAAAKAAALPTAAEAPAPPAADMPQELTLGGHHKHVQMNVDNLHIETTPISVSRRKIKSGLQGLKAEERKKANLIFLCLIGGGMTFGVIVFTWAIVSGKFSTTKEVAQDPMAAASPADSGKPAAKDTADKKPPKETVKVEQTEPDRYWPLGVKSVAGNVEVNVIKLTRGAPPEGLTDETDVLFVHVTLELKAGKAKQVEVPNWSDASVKKKVLLADDTKIPYKLYGEVDKDGKTIAGKQLTITETRTKVQLVFEAPTSKKLKSLLLKLPGPEGTMIGYKFNAGEIPAAQTKPAEADTAAAPTKADDGDSTEPPKQGKKKAHAVKPADADDSDPAETPPRPIKRKPRARPADADSE